MCAVGKTEENISMKSMREKNEIRTESKQMSANCYFAQVAFKASSQIQLIFNIHIHIYKLCHYYFAIFPSYH